ncbi:hypothetical protein BpHYR1_048213 [Brachionus plicatilis]|uniref:Uncharacterized protein n=1 Tax=Brachionus plicatilis TaxID=10195 RepID=A0A3M7QKL3_BRAPC|nr:hypothetical protein BpHYR1_048213 [Brachionus plicatilis]
MNHNKNSEQIFCLSKILANRYPGVAYHYCYYDRERKLQHFCGLSLITKSRLNFYLNLHNWYYWRKRFLDNLEYYGLNFDEECEF